MARSRPISFLYAQCVISGRSVTLNALQEVSMFEIAMIGIGIGLFAAAALYVVACGRL